MSIEKRIEEVQRKHREELHEEGICICGWHANVETDYPAHVAAAVVRALALREESSRARCKCGHHVDIHRRSNSVNFCFAVVEGSHCPCNNFVGDDNEFGPHFNRWVTDWELS